MNLTFDLYYSHIISFSFELPFHQIFAHVYGLYIFWNKEAHGVSIPYSSVKGRFKKRGENSLC